MNKKILRILKANKTKLLNKNCKDFNEFEEIQDKLNFIELQIKEVISNETNS